MKKDGLLHKSEGRDADAIAELADVLAVKGGNAQKSSYVAMNMSPA